MKKSNKVTAFYVIASLLLFLTLLGGGVYGVYLSVGINFMRSTVSNVTDAAAGGTAQNVAYGGMVDFQPSMIGVIILSIVLIVISIFDLISLFRQIVFFKQFKLIRESRIEKFVEGKIKSKSSVVFFAVFINIISFIAGVAGIFINATTFVNASMSWILYVVDGMVSVLSIVSLVLLIKKVKMQKKARDEVLENEDAQDNYDQETPDIDRKGDGVTENHTFVEVFETDDKEDKLNDFEAKRDDINHVEYVLLKLKNMKEAKVITNDEYELLREKHTGLPREKKTNKKRKVVKKKIAK